MKIRLTSAFLAAIMILGALMIVPAGADEYFKVVDKITMDSAWQQSSSSNMFSLDSDEKQHFNYDVPAGGVTMIVFFSAGGNSNSKDYIENLSASPFAKDPRVNIVALEMTGCSRGDVKSYMAEHDKNGAVDKVFYNESGTYLPTYYSQMVDSERLSAVYLALVFFVTRENGQNVIRYYIDGQSSLLATTKALSDFIDFGDEVSLDLYYVTPIGTLRFDYAVEVADMVNRTRKDAGLSTLTVSAQLMKLAMTRAIECSINYDHVRPNGEKCFSVTLDGMSYSGFICAENIAVGLKTPEDVMRGWVNSKSHYKNLANPDAEQIGVGVFHNGRFIYWVQLFGKGSDAPLLGEDGKPYAEVIENVALPIETLGEIIDVDGELKYDPEIPASLEEGNIAGITVPYWYNKNPHWVPYTTECIPASVEIISDGTISCKYDAQFDSVMGFRTLPSRTLTIAGTGECTMRTTLFKNAGDAYEAAIPGVFPHDLVAVDAADYSEDAAEGEQFWRCLKCGRIFTSPDALEALPEETTAEPATTEPPVIEEPDTEAPDGTPDKQGRLPGDSNGDGKTNAKDVVLIMNFLVGNADGADEGLLDFDGNGKVNAKDVTKLMKYIVAQA